MKETSTRPPVGGDAKPSLLDNALHALDDFNTKQLAPLKRRELHFLSPTEGFFGPTEDDLLVDGKPASPGSGSPTLGAGEGATGGGGPASGAASNMTSTAVLFAASRARAGRRRSSVAGTAGPAVSFAQQMGLTSTSFGMRAKPLDAASFVALLEKEAHSKSRINPLGTILCAWIRHTRLRFTCTHRERACLTRTFVVPQLTMNSLPDVSSFVLALQTGSGRALACHARSSRTFPSPTRSKIFCMGLRQRQTRWACIFAGTWATRCCTT